MKKLLLVFTLGVSLLAGAQTPEESRELEWLYRYMSVPDSADYSRDFYLENVKASLKARKEMSWGKVVPDREWRHFVLPVRVNNENLDSSRMVFYKELKPRVEGLSMTDAALEVNHWAHEKVTYQPSDARTSSPLVTASNALGRCGEESTFVVAALRAVGIPARQIYTPRWAHTDDNHAWVEVWTDGAWHYLGACEPEAILDLAWFNQPASRGMLMSTRVIGEYDGPEEVLSRNELYTNINVTANYAPVRDVKVKVTDADGKPVDGAEVSFRLYNYAEFYPLAIKKSDEKGEALLTAGYGDLLVFARKNGRFGFAKATPGADVTEVSLALDGNSQGKWDFDIVPPEASATLPAPTQEAAELNEARKAKEDSIRKAYEATFADSNVAAELAKKIGVPELEGRMAAVLVASRGNHAVISDFLASVGIDNVGKALDLLEAVNEKDLHDLTADVLNDHLMATPVADSPLYKAYVLNPRVETEMLTPYKEFIASKFPADMIARFKADPEKWVEWVKDSIQLRQERNPMGMRMSPQSVWRQRRADARSKAIFFVAGARSFGIPSRIDPVTGKIQWHRLSDGDWNDAALETVDANSQESKAPKGTLVLKSAHEGRLSDPLYYSHFTVAKINDGSPETLGFPEGASLSQLDKAISLDAGQYMMTTGQRMADGSVLTRNVLFQIEPDKVLELPVEIRQDSAGVQVIGQFNSEDLYHDRIEGAKSILSTTGRGYYVLVLGAPGHEPTAHVLNDISAVRADLEKAGIPIVMLLRDRDDFARFDASLYPDLPSTLTLGADIGGAIAKELKENLELPDGELPIVVVADTFNRVVGVFTGYSIGMGGRLLDLLSRL